MRTVSRTTMYSRLELRMIFNVRRHIWCGVALSGIILTLVGLGVPSGSRGEQRAISGTAQTAQNNTAVKKIPFPKPLSHDGNWLQYHGAVADVSVSDRENGCYTCHAKHDCIECHNTIMPRDHNNTWRTMSHGFQASGNRERCLRCHRQDYCVRCHNETAPRTHRGNWIDRHCHWCHFGPGVAPADNCVVCHKQAPHTSVPVGHPPIGGQTTCIQVGCHQ